MLRWRAVAAYALMALLPAACGKPALPAPAATDSATATASPTPATASLSGQPASALHLDAVDFLNPQIGWLAGHLGNDAVILRTLDGGATWEQLPAGGNAFVQLDFVDPDDGWALVRAAGGLQIEHTADGGATWAVQWLGPATDMHYVVEAEDARVHMLDPRGGYALFGGQLLATANGGAAWTAMALPSGFQPTGMAWRDARHGWLAGTVCPSGAAPTASASPCRVAVLATGDGGATWSRAFTSTEAAMPLNDGAALPSLSFPTAGDGWLYFKTSTLQGRLYSTSDGGATWVLLQPDLAGGRGIVGDPAFPDADSGWLPRDAGAAPQAGGVQVTHDGGRTWSWVGEARGWSITALSVVSATQGWAIGYRAPAPGETFLIGSSDGGTTWSEYPLTLRPTRSVDFLSGTLGYGAGSAAEPGAVLRSTDGGATWTVRSLLPGSVAAISFIDAQQGWALDRPWPSSQQLLDVMATADGGATWREVAQMAQASPSVPVALRFFAARQGLLMMGGPPGWTVLKSANGGTTWSEAGHLGMVPNGPALAALAAPADLLLLSGTPALLRSTDGGASWTALPRLPSHLGRGTGLGAAGTRDLWVFERQAARTTLLRSDDGGLTWTALRMPARMPLDGPLAVWAQSPQAAWVLSQAGLFATHDGGRTWTWLR